MLSNSSNSKKKTLEDFDKSMKLFLNESVKFFPVSSITRIRRQYKALNILRKDGSLKYFINEWVFLFFDWTLLFNVTTSKLFEIPTWMSELLKNCFF